MQHFLIAYATLYDEEMSLQQDSKTFFHDSFLLNDKVHALLNNQPMFPKEIKFYN